MKIKSENTKCAGRRWTGQNFRPCKFKGTLEHNGLLWCKRHHLPSVEVKRKEQEDRWRKEWAEKESLLARQKRNSYLGSLAIEWLRANKPDVLAELEAKL